jgi:hypothetical protein
MPRPKSPRGKESPRLTIRMSQAEWNWLLDQSLRLERSLNRIARDRVFASMPGYRP